MNPGDQQNPNFLVLDPVLSEPIQRYNAIVNTNAQVVHLFTHLKQFFEQDPNSESCKRVLTQAGKLVEACKKAYTRFVKYNSQMLPIIEGRLRTELGDHSRSVEDRIMLTERMFKVSEFRLHSFRLQEHFRSSFEDLAGLIKKFEVIEEP